MTAGRPTDYDPNIHPAEAIELARKGLTNTEIADRMGIACSTLKLWRKLHPEFSAAVKEGKDSADDLVIESLFKRARGYEVVEEKAMNIDGDVQIVRLEKHIPGDPTSMIFWLKNRQPEDWGDKKQVELSGPEGYPIKAEVSVSLTDKLAKYKDLFNDEYNQQ